MRTRISTSLCVAALLGTATVPVRGQEPVVDSRWLAYLGCWESIESAKSRICIVPAAGTSAVELVTMVKGETVTRERIAAKGETVETARGACAVAQTAEWSARGQRVYLRSRETCAPPGATTRDGTGLIAMTGDGEWLYIQGMTLGGQTGVSVQRYREIASDSLLPDDILKAVQRDVAATRRARAAARAPLSGDDVVEANKHLDTAVLETWLVERGDPFTLDAKRLIALADAGVPSRVIDLMVALSYPRVFAVNAASREGERRATPTRTPREGVGGMGGYGYGMSPLCSSVSLLSFFYAPYDCLGYGRYRYGYGYGYGWYPGSRPVTIIFVGSGGGSRPHGRVVNGQGYRRGADTDSNALPRQREPASTGSTSGTGSRGSGSSSSSGSGEQRTAKPRPPQ